MWTFDSSYCFSNFLEFQRAKTYLPVILWTPDFKQCLRIDRHPPQPKKNRRTEQKESCQPDPHFIFKSLYLFPLSALKHSLNYFHDHKPRWTELLTPYLMPIATIHSSIFVLYGHVVKHKSEPLTRLRNNKQACSHLVTKTRPESTFP